MIENDVALKFEDLKRSFDLSFQQPLVERGQELVHLLIVRIGVARFALKVADLAGTRPCPDRGTDSRARIPDCWASPD